VTISVGWTKWGGADNLQGIHSALRCRECLVTCERGGRSPPGLTPDSRHPPTPSDTPIAPPPSWLINHASSPPVSTFSGCGILDTAAFRASETVATGTPVGNQTANKVSSVSFECQQGVETFGHHVAAARAKTSLVSDDKRARVCDAPNISLLGTHSLGVPPAIRAMAYTRHTMILTTRSSAPFRQSVLASR
jgi:hypothetical protein